MRSSVHFGVGPNPNFLRRAAAAAGRALPQNVSAPPLSSRLLRPGIPLELVEPEILRFKVFEPVLLLGRARFANVDMRVRVKGGGHVSQIYGARRRSTRRRSRKAARNRGARCALTRTSLRWPLAACPCAAR